MTLQRTFKQSVRERMQKTGERYTAARAMLLRDRAAPKSTPTSLFPNYPAPGGICQDTGAMRNVLAAHGLKLSEAAVTGMCGGIGFLYAMFEYKTSPPMLSILTRYDTMPDSFIAGGLTRLGVKSTIHETGSSAVARKALDAALAAKQPVLCTVDCVAISPEADNSNLIPGCGAPTVVAVAGVDGDELLVDDGGTVLRRITRERFARARAFYKKGRNRMITLDGSSGKVDLGPAMETSIAATAERFSTAPYKGFASNFGFTGLEKWQRLLTDPHDRKGWPAVFPEGRLAYLALRRTHDGIEHEFTAPAAGRPLYAEFLLEAAKTTSDKRYESAAKLFRKSGEHWTAIAEVIRTCGDPTIEEGCRLRESFRELLDEVKWPNEGEAARLIREQRSVAKQCRMAAARARELYAELAGHVGKIVGIEREAVEVLTAR